MVNGLYALINGRIGGVLSKIDIDIDKDWAAKRIYNLAEISIGDIVFKNNWRLTEGENAIALIDNKGNIVRRWTNE